MLILRLKERKIEAMIQRLFQNGMHIVITPNTLLKKLRKVIWTIGSYEII